jgi:hypothetical protein
MERANQQQKYATTADVVPGRDQLMLSVPTDPGSPPIYYDTTTDDLRRCIGLLRRLTKLDRFPSKTPAPPRGDDRPYVVTDHDI